MAMTGRIWPAGLEFDTCAWENAGPYSDAPDKIQHGSFQIESDSKKKKNALMHSSILLCTNSLFHRKKAIHIFLFTLNSFNTTYYFLKFISKQFI